MEIQLQELIEQIKKEGVDAAALQASKILDAANAKAEKIVDEAKAEADKLMADAKLENERFVRVSEDAIRQAGRNLLISFRNSVNLELNAIVDASVKTAFSIDKVSELILKAIDLWLKNTDAENISALLASEDLKLLEENLYAALKEKMLNGVTLKANNDIEGGFRIAAEGSGVYYDYSAAAVTDMLSAYLNPRVTALMKEAEK